MSNKTLAELNKAVDDAVAERTKWLDDQMVLKSKFKPGDEIYDLSTGKRLGIMHEPYRYHAGDFRSEHGLLPQIYSLDVERSVCKCKIAQCINEDSSYGEMLSFEQVTESLTNNS